MMRVTLLAAGFVLWAMQFNVHAQWNLQAPDRFAQADRSVLSVEPPQSLPRPQSAVRVIKPASGGPQPLPGLLDAPAAQVQPSEGTQFVDFDEILADQEANAGSGCQTQCSDCPPRYSRCQVECQEPCCLAAFCGLDPTVKPPPIGVDPLVSISLEDIYRTPDCCRGLWSTYPAEKMRESLQLRRCQVPPPACSDYMGGPMLCRPAGHPLCRQPLHACQQHAQDGHKVDCSECQQAQANQQRVIR